MTTFKLKQFYSSELLHRAFVIVSFFSMLVLFSFSCRKESVVSEVAALDPAIISAENALREVSRFVELGAKVAGTQGAETAALYLRDRLSGAGLGVQVEVFSEGGITYRNVISVAEGGNRGMIVLAGHYDTKSGISDYFAGANDSGSSTGLLLHMAEVISQVPDLPCDIMFAFLDGEECRESYSDDDGLHGSRRLASQLADDRSWKILAVVVIDMIGDRELTVTMPRNSSPELLSMVFDAAREEGVRSKFSLYKGEILDDHVPFLRKGFPAVDIIDFEYGSDEGLNDYWHTDEDTMDKISSESLGVIGRVVVRVLNKIMQI